MAIDLLAFAYMKIYQRSSTLTLIIVILIINLGLVIDYITGFPTILLVVAVFVLLFIFKLLKILRDK